MKDLGNCDIRLICGNKLRAEYNLPFLTGLLAETCLACGQLDESSAIIDEQLSRIERTGQEQWRSLLLLLKGDLLLARGDGDIDGAEHCYIQALEARPNPVRKVLGTPRCASSRPPLVIPDRAAEARSVLAPALSWFSEGFDTPDWKEATSLVQIMDDASSPPARFAAPT